MQCRNEVIEIVYDILKNPITPQIKNCLYIKNNNKIIKTCALGEIGLQLQIKNITIFSIINKLIKLGIPEQLANIDPGNYASNSFCNSILKWNDCDNLSKTEIAYKIKEKFGDVK